MSNESTKFHYGYIIVLCCCLIMGVNVGLVMSCAGIFYQPVSEELGVSVGQFGLYMSFNYLTSTLMLSVAGRMLERFSARYLLAASSAVLGLCLVAMGFFNAVWQFYAAGCIIGITLAFLLYLSFPTMVNRCWCVRYSATNITHGYIQMYPSHWQPEVRLLPEVGVCWRTIPHSDLFSRSVSSF